MQIILNEKFDWATLNNEQVFKDLYKRYFVQLYRFAVSLVHCNETAEEIIHDVLVNLWKKRNSFSEIENLNTYLYVSVRNLCLNSIRDEGKHHHVDIETLYDEQSSGSVDPESLLISKEKLQGLNNVIDQLPARCKLIFRLVKEDGLKYKQVAAVLNISVKTVENQMTIAVKKIASVYQR
jgi:RNA polymerase sigma-70 factor (ECF subfamily)